MEFRVWTRVTGVNLPFKPFRVGASQVGPVSGGYRPPGYTAPSLSLDSAEQSYFVGTSPRLEVVSDCWILTEGVQAADSWSAMLQVEENELPAILAALSCGREEPTYRVEVVGADDGSNGYGNSPLVSTAFFPNEDLDPDGVEQVKDRVNLTIAHPKLKLAVSLLHRGVKYGDMNAGSLSASASILAMYQVIETLAEIVPWAPAPDHEDKRRQVVVELQRKLDRLTSTSKQVSAIESARDQLRRLDAKFIGLRVTHTAEVLGLGKDWTTRQVALAKLRNTKLGHPAENLPLSILDEWSKLDAKPPLSAYGLASTMLAAAYLHFKA